MIVFRKRLPNVEYPLMEADVTIVGGGPAGLACALKLSQLIDAHNTAYPRALISKENIYVLEKARDLGKHLLSGALLDPHSMDELLPGWKMEAPIESKVTREALYYLTRKGKLRVPIIPPPLRDRGNYVISLNRFIEWLGAKVEQSGITIFTGFAGSDLLLERGKITGVRTDDKGLDKQNQPKSNFEPGYDLKSKILILAEGPRGSLTKQLVEHFQFDLKSNPMTYGVGMKELWELPPGRVPPGEVIYTMGWPLTKREYSGAWIYGIRENMISLGFVIGLEYHNPRTDSHHVLQSFKQHPFVRRLLEGGKIVRYGAKTLPYGGWWAMPPLAGDGWMIIGDSAGFLNSQRLKGIHLAIKSGMLAAETAFEALVANDFSAAQLLRFKQKVDTSWIRQELYPVRNFHQGFEGGLVRGMAHAALQQITGGRGLFKRYAAYAGHTRMYTLTQTAGSKQPEQITGWAKGDGQLTFDKLTDLYYSGTRHEEDQPAHLIILDTNICNTRCVVEYGNPCQFFCPASVYEMIESSTALYGKEINENPSNCVHCKACDIMDPYQIITWVPPEGGGGPSYDGM